MQRPNILVRTSAENFTEQQKLINSVVRQNCYTSYHLNDEKFHKHPWCDACVFLLYEYDKSRATNTDELKMLGNFMNNHGGKVLLHGGTVYEDWLPGLLENVSLAGSIAQKAENNLIMNLGKIVESHFELHASLLKRELTDIPVNELAEIFRDLGVVVGKREENEVSLPAYFYSVDESKIEEVFNFQHNLKEICGRKLKLSFIEQCNEKSESAGNDITPPNNQSGGITSNNGSQSDEVVLNIVYNCHQSSNFNWKLYKKKLRTKRYGKNLIYKDIMQSTHDIFTKLHAGSVKCDGLVAVAAQQTKGIGRAGNQWLSPLGCMMFSLQVGIPLESLLGQRLSLVQHIAVVAFVKSIKEREGYEKLDISIKWPNYIYMKGVCKIGGAIVYSSFFQGMFKVAIGLGVNISNAEPNDCVNNLIRQHNEECKATLQSLRIADVLAGTINKIEYLVERFQEEGVDSFKADYYSCWMHNGAEVTLESDNNAKAFVRGIDEFGCLAVETDKGRKVTLQPDGNSFDMMRNMITLKK